MTPPSLSGTPLRITEEGEPILRRTCRRVSEFGAERWKRLIDDMFTTMWIAEGCGLAANQVDVDAQLFVYDLTDEYGRRHVGHVFNPVVEVVGVRETSHAEGCLSIPGPTTTVTRPAQVTLHGVDLNGIPLTLHANDYLARCLQHETEHLLGTLYPDHVSKSSRRRVYADSARLREDVLEQRAARSTALGKQPAGYPAAPPGFARQVR
jgi:peptide deformylase